MKKDSYLLLGGAFAGGLLLFFIAYFFLGRNQENDSPPAPTIIADNFTNCEETIKQYAASHKQMEKQMKFLEVLDEKLAGIPVMEASLGREGLVQGADWLKSIEGKIDDALQMLVRYQEEARNQEQFKSLIANLRASLSRRAKEIEDLKRGIEVRDRAIAQIQNLKDSLDNVNTQLSFEKMTLENAVSSATRELGRKFYVIVEKKETQRVREWKGGRIPIEAKKKKVDVVSDHDSGSYRIDDTGKFSELEIKNEEVFWARSKLLIIDAR